jgi:hypothetical protein
VPGSFFHFRRDDLRLNQQSADTIDANAPGADIASQTSVFTPFKCLTIIFRKQNRTATANRGIRIIMGCGSNDSPSNGCITNIKRKSERTRHHKKTALIHIICQYCIPSSILKIIPFRKKQLTKHLNITLIPNGFKTKFEMQTDFPDCQPVTPVTKAFLSNCHVFQHMAVFIPSESSKD